MILSILISVCGFFSVKRIFQPIFFIFEPTKRKKIVFGILFLSIHWLGFHFFGKKGLQIWIYEFVLLVLSFLASQKIKKDHANSAQDKFLQVIDETYLDVMAGHSLRASLIRVVGREQGGIGLQIKNMILSLSEMDAKDQIQLPFLVEIRAELIRIENSSKNILEQLRVFRRTLRTEIYFRHKSGQVLKNIRIQAWSILVLYFLMGFFVSTQVNLLQFPRLILGSLLLLILGLGFIFSIGRQLKWKV